MNIKEFLNIYGENTTTNFQLMKWAEDLDIPNFYYAMRDEIKELIKKKKNPLYVIANYHNSNQNGIHHVALFKDKDKDISYYFDSYGIIPFREAINFLDTKDRFYSSFQIQKPNTKLCGQLSLYILFKLSKGADFFETVLELATALK